MGCNVSKEKVEWIDSDGNLNPEVFVESDFDWSTYEGPVYHTHNTAIAWEEYAAVKEVEHMDNVEVLMYVDKRTVCSKEMDMKSYREKAVELKLEERK